MCLLGRASLTQELHYSMVDISCEVGLSTICVQNNIFVFGFKALVEHITWAKQKLLIKIIGFPWTSKNIDFREQLSCEKYYLKFCIVCFLIISDKVFLLDGDKRNRSILAIKENQINFVLPCNYRHNMPLKIVNYNV